MTKSNLTLVYKAIVLLLMFGFGLLPPFGEMTQFGMRILGIFIGSIFGWIAIDLLWPSLVGIIALGMCGAFDSMAANFAAVFGTQTSMMLLCAVFICAFIEQKNLSSVIVGALMNMKIAKKSPFIMSFLFFMAAFIVSALSHSVVTCLLFVALYRKMAQTCKVPPQHYTNSYWLVGIALIAVFGDISFPFKPVSIAILGTYSAFTGSEISFVQYLLFMTLVLIIVSAGYVLVGRLLRVDLSFFENAELDIGATKATREQKISLIFMVILLLVLIVPSVFSTSDFVVFRLMNQMGYGGVMLALIVVMMLWPVNGKPLMDLQALSANFNWGIYICISYFMTMASFIDKPESGISASLQSAFAPLLSALPPIAFLIVAILLSVILTNVLNNMVVAVVFITIMFTLESYLTGINMQAATLAIVLASFAACATPAANPANAFVFSNRDLISVKNQIVHGVKTCLVLTLVIVVCYYPLLCLFL